MMLRYLYIAVLVSENIYLSLLGHNKMDTKLVDIMTGEVWLSILVVTMDLI